MDILCICFLCHLHKPNLTGYDVNLLHTQIYYFRANSTKDITLHTDTNCFSLYFVKQTAVIDQSVWRLGYRLDDWGSIPSRGWEFSSSLPCPDWLWGPPPIQWTPWAISLGVKRPGSEADHSPPPSAEVKNAWSYTSTPQYVLMAWCLVKQKDKFTFTLIFP
jgi:hypothetical protein